LQAVLSAVAGDFALGLIELTPGKRALQLEKKNTLDIFFTSIAKLMRLFFGRISVTVNPKWG